MLEPLAWSSSTVRKYSEVEAVSHDLKDDCSKDQHTADDEFIDFHMCLQLVFKLAKSK